MATRQENEKAVADILPTYLLDEFIDWISSNMIPEDVFTEDRLSKWAVENNHVKVEDV
jgi:hypothetical protein